MRLIAFILTVCFASGPSAAQDWKEHSYADYGFSVAFPADPKIETTVYQTLDGRSVPARVYSVTHANAVFKLTIAEFSGTSLGALGENAVIDFAVKALTRGSEIKLNLPHRVRLVYGRQLSLVGADGSYSFVAVFYYKQRLYQLEGKALAVTGNDARPEAMRFQQSLDFIDSAVRRPPRATRKG